MKKTAKNHLSLCSRGTGTEPLRLRQRRNNSNNGGNDKPDSTPTPEYVYASSFSKLNNGDGHTYLNPFLFTETGFYTVENEKSARWARRSRRVRGSVRHIRDPSVPQRL